MTTQTQLIMGMPITLTINGQASGDVFDMVFEYFRRIDNQFSLYKESSEISRINKGLSEEHWTKDVKKIFKLAEQTKQETDGYFDIVHGHRVDPSGLVKGWAIHQAANKLLAIGIENFCLDAGGDLEVQGTAKKNQPWLVGIRNPFSINQTIKILSISGRGVATSGNYIRGNHIYNPKDDKSVDSIVSLTVVGPNIYEADRFATAAFAMGDSGIDFIEALDGFEGYMVGDDQLASYTSGFMGYVHA